jgi:DNA-binding transcriptional MerR regulator
MAYFPIPISHHRFEEKFPGWATLVDVVTHKVITLGGVLDCLDVTKQQIDYWIQKGVLPTDERTGSTWRRFSILDVLLLAVAAAFKSKGIEVAKIAFIRELLPIWRKFEDWTDCFVYIIHGYDVFLYTDFNRIAGTIPIEDKEAVPLLKLRITEESKFLAAVSLKKICDELAPKIEQPFFKVKILPDGSYEFFINQVPLKLESLRKEDSPHLLEKLKGRTRKRRKK